MKNIILIAAPSAGKGTEASRIKNEFNIPHISTGDLLREAAKKPDELSKQISELIENGKFVSDEIVLDLLKSRILQDDCKEGYILDGFPRNVSQAKAYDKILSDIGKDIGIVIVLDVSKEIAQSRMSGRYTCSNCGKIYNINNDNMKPTKDGICDICNSSLTRRIDDNPEVYTERYNTYLEKTEPLISYYDEKGIVYHVDANGTQDDTHMQIVKILGE